MYDVSPDRQGAGGSSVPCTCLSHSAAAAVAHTPQTGLLKPQALSARSSAGWESKVKELGDSVSGEASPAHLLGLGWCLLAVSLRGGRRRGTVCRLLYKDTDPGDGAPPPDLITPKGRSSYPHPFGG